MANKSPQIKPRLTVLGSSNTDLIVRVPRLPLPGETLLGGEFAKSAGGKGANQAVAAARAGADVAFIARVGRDDLGDEALVWFQREDLEVGHVIRDARAPSGVALILVAADGQNSIAVASGANARMTVADVRRAKAVIANSATLVMQLETPLPAVEAAAKIAAQAGVPVILNPAPAASLPDSLLRLVSVLTPNETEAEILTGVRVSDPAGAAAAAAQLRAQGAGTVIITMGARGVFVSSAGEEKMVHGFKVRAVDTVAAGDVFTGALAVALAERRPLLEAVRFGQAAAAISVTRAGAQPSIPRRREIERFLREQSAAPGIRKASEKRSPGL